MECSGQVMIGVTNYTTLQAAFTAINNGLQTGAITILITGNTTEVGTATLNASGTGAANYTSVSITPQSAGLIIASGSNPSINFNGADNVTINGDVAGARGLTFRQTGNNVTIQYLGDASNNSILNTIIESNSNSANGSVFLSTGTTTGNDNILLSNCEFRNRSDVAIGGGTGVAATTNVPRTAFRCAGTSTAISNDNITIQNCLFYNFFVSTTGSPTTVDVASNTTSFIFRYNHIYQTANFFGAAAFTSYLTLVNIGATGTNNIIIRKNNFGGRAANCGGGAFVLRNPNGNRCRIRTITSAVAGTNTITIDSNTVANIQMNFYLNTCGGQDAFLAINCGGSGVATVAHNTIGTTTGTGSILLSQQVNNVSGCNVSVSGIEYNASAGSLHSNKVGGFTFSYAVASNFGFSFNGLRITNTAANAFSIYNNIVGSATTANNILFDANSSANQVRGINSVANNNQLAIYDNVIANITDNTFNASAFLYGLQQNGTASAFVYNNQFYNLSSGSTMAYTSVAATATAGIVISSTGLFEINNNSIYSIRSTASATSAGTAAGGIMITSSSVTANTIYNNRIYDISNTSGGTFPVASGILLKTFGSNTTIYNNMISLGLNTDGSSNNVGAAYIGLWNGVDNPANPINFIYNTVSISGNATSGTYSSYGFLRGDNDGSGVTTVTTPVQVYNNVFHNSRMGIGSHFAIGNLDTPTGWAQAAPCGAGLSPDYNALLSSSVSTVGQWLGVSHDFVNWQTNSSGDANSVDMGMGTIAFAMVQAADLHVPNSEIRINAKGIPLTTIQVDFDLNFRRGVDIGADEVQNIITSNPIGDNWHVAANWTPAQIPTCADSVVIPVGADKRIYAASAQYGYFYTLTIDNGATLTMENATQLEGCWHYNGTTHRGQFLNNGNYVANASTLNIAGRFTDNNSFQKGTSLTQLNKDTPDGLPLCVSNFINSFNILSPISDISGTVNTNFHNLSILNAGTTTIVSVKDVLVGDAVSDAGLLTISNGGWLAINGNTLTIEGDLASTTGTLTGSAASTLIVNGSGTLTGTLNFTNNFTPDNELENLVINRIASGFVTLGNNDVIVNTLLDLSNGIFITTGNYEVNVTNNAINAVQNYHSGAFVDGYIRRAITGMQQYDFPVGNGTNYELATMEITSPLGVTSIRGYFDPTNATDPNSNLPLNDAGTLYDILCSGGVWELLPNIPASGSYNLTLNGTGFSCSSFYTIAGQDAANDWQFGGSSFVSVNNRDGFDNLVADLTRFTYVYSTALPVDWLKFEAYKKSSSVVLNWETSSETNNDYFIVQRSLDGISFQSLAVVKGSRNTSSINSYSHEDKTPLSGISYYRIAQVDVDGKMSYSVLRSVNFSSTISYELYPNPSTGNFVISYPFERSDVRLAVRVYDVIGKEYTEWFMVTTTDSNFIQMNLVGETFLADGVYVVSIDDGLTVVNERIIFRK